MREVPGASDMPGGDMESIRVVAERRALADAVIRGDERGKMYGLFLQSFRRERGTSRDTGRGGSRRTSNPSGRHHTAAGVAGLLTAKVDKLRGGRYRSPDFRRDEFRD